MSKSKSKSPHKKNAILHLLELIEGTNKEIEISKKMNSQLMLKQANHLKKQYTKDLFKLLEVYQLPLKFEIA